FCAPRRRLPPIVRPSQVASRMAFSSSPPPVAPAWHVFRNIRTDESRIRGGLSDIHEFRRNAMLQWALTFLVLALLAAVFGFGGIAASFAMIGKVLFFVFLVLFLVSLLTGAV